MYIKFIFFSYVNKMVIDTFGIRRVKSKVLTVVPKPVGLEKNVSENITDKIDVNVHAENKIDLEQAQPLLPQIDDKSDKIVVPKTAKEKKEEARRRREEKAITID